MLFDIWQRATKKEKALMFCGRFKYNRMWIFLPIIPEIFYFFGLKKEVTFVKVYL